MVWLHLITITTLEASSRGRRIPGPSVLELDGPLFMPAESVQSAPVCGDRLARQLVGLVGRIGSSPSTSPVDRISGPSSALTPGSRHSEPTGALTATVAASAARPGSSPTSASDVPGRIRPPRPHDVEPGRLGHDRHRAAGARVGLDDDHPISGGDHLHVEIPRTPRARACDRPPRPRAPASSRETRCGGSTATVSPECTPGGSICSRMPGTAQSLPSLIASTSSSMPSHQLVDAQRPADIRGEVGRRGRRPSGGRRCPVRRSPRTDGR